MATPGSPQPGASADDDGFFGAFGPTNTPFDSLGGNDRVRALVTSFYDHMDNDAAFRQTRALYPADTTDSRQKLFEFLVGWLGGPQLYIEKHGHPRLRGRHMAFAIGDTERDQWLACMGMAMDELKVEGELRRFLDARFSHVAEFMRNR